MFKKWMLVILLCLFLFSCGSRKPKPTLSANERLEYALKKFNDGDYLDAKSEFRIIVLNFPGHDVVDDAQYYLAESHFKMKEYILAIAEYEKFVRMFPNSPFIDDAQYKIGLSNYKLSPKYSLDQVNTLKAIEELQRFIEDYPESEYNKEAAKLMGKCRDKLAKKEYKNGELYRKMSIFQSAIIYFESVLTNYYDTKYASDAQFWLAECLRREGEYDRATKEFGSYLQKYPNSKRKDTVKKLLKQIEHDRRRAELKKEKEADNQSNP